MAAQAATPARFLDALGRALEGEPEALEAAHAVLLPLLARRSPLRLERQGGSLHLDGCPLGGEVLARAMAPRGLRGLAFHPGVDEDDLQTLLFALQMEPARLAELGGVEGLIPGGGLRVKEGPGEAQPEERPDGHPEEHPEEHPQEPPETFQVEPAPPEPRMGQLAAELRAEFTGIFGELFQEPAPALASPAPQATLPAPEAPPRGPLAEDLGARLKGVLGQGRSLPGRPDRWPPEEREALSRAGCLLADLASLRGLDQLTGLARLDPPSAREVLRGALAPLGPGELGSLLLGLEGLEGEQALRSTLDYLAPELYAQAVALSRAPLGEDRAALAYLSAGLLRVIKDRDLALEALRGRLLGEGMEAGETELLLKDVRWELQGMETQVRRGIGAWGFFDLEPHQARKLMEQILSQGRWEDLKRLLDQLREGLTHPEMERRNQAMEALAGLCGHLPAEPLPEDLEERLWTLARFQLDAEDEREPFQWACRALEGQLAHWMDLGRFETAHRELLALAAFTREPQRDFWQLQAVRDTLGRLAAPPRVALLVPRLHEEACRESLPALHALLALLGPAAARYLVVCLGLQEDRPRRGQLLAALRSMGGQATEPLRQALDSPEWYLARNAALLLGEIGDPASLPSLEPCLRHGDARVRRAAQAAVNRLRGV